MMDEVIITDEMIKSANNGVFLEKYDDYIQKLKNEGRYKELSYILEIVLREAELSLFFYINGRP